MWGALSELGGRGVRRGVLEACVALVLVAGVAPVAASNVSAAVTVRLAVPGKPTVTVTDSSMLVSWTAPTSGVPIADYVVQRASRPSGPYAEVTEGTCATHPLTVTSCTVTGSTGGAAYYFKVAVTNVVGASKASAKVTAATLPGAVVGPTCAEVSAIGVAKVAWGAAAGNGSKVTGYEYSFKRGSGVWSAWVSNRTSRRLSLGVGFTVRVRATNAMGTGPTSSCFTGTTPSTTPPQATQITAGGQHSCALLADTTVKCWGWNVYYGLLGNGTDINYSDTPVTVTGITGVIAVAAGGFHSCALLANTTIKCWGYNAWGQLGNGTNTDSKTAVTVTGITGVTAIAAGGSHSCALLADTTVKCWGNNFGGQLGNGTNTDSNTPVTVTGITGATAIAAGSNYSCALLADTTVKCWGYNYSGSLGNGRNTDSNTAVSVSGISGVTAITAGESPCVLLVDTTVKCWGDNWNGTLGNGTNTDSNTAVTVTGITGATAIAASCALLADTTVKCWGFYGKYQLGRIAEFNTAKKRQGIAGATAITAGSNNSCALLADTTVKCWGNNNNGGLGNGRNTDTNFAQKVIGL